jgi:hypothetical protein
MLMNSMTGTSLDRCVSTTVYRILQMKLCAAKITFAFAVSLLIVPAYSACAQVATDEERARGDQYETITEATLGSLVRVKCVMTMESPWGGEAEEQEMELSGTLISADGNVLLANSMIGGLYGRMYGGVQTTLRDIKVLVGDDTEGLDATIIARDTDRDLCWLTLDEKPAEPLPFLDITEVSERPIPGQSVFQTTRLGEFFARAPIVSEAHISAELNTPRDLLYISTNSLEVGLPAVDRTGAFVGFVITQMPDSDELEATGGMGGSWSESYIWAVLPAAEVAKATDIAMSLLDEEE